MATYQLLKIREQAEAIVAEIQKAKDDGNYDARADGFDKRMADRLQPMSDLAMKWTRDHDKKTLSAAKAFKVQFEKYAKADKKKSYDEKSVAELKQAVLSASNNLKSLNDDSADMAKALVPQYRNDAWIKTARDAMSNPSAVLRMQNDRKDGIAISENSAKNRKILATIEKQLRLFYKKGLAKIKGEGNMSGIKEDIDGLVASMNEQKTNGVESKIYAGNQGLSILGLIKADIKKGKEPRKDDVTSMTKYIKSFDPAVKEAKEKLKLMMIEVATLNKRVKSVTGMESIAKGPVKEAETIIKECQKTIAAQAKMYKAGEKDFAKIMKGK